MIKANDPTLHSWIQIAPDCDFPIQNLPFGVFQTDLKDPRVGVAIGEYVLDLCVLGQYDMFVLTDIDPTVFHRPYLNDFIALGKPTWRAIRNRVSELLRNDNDEISGNSQLMHDCLLKRSEVEMLMPVKLETQINNQAPEKPDAGMINTADIRAIFPAVQAGAPVSDFLYGQPAASNVTKQLQFIPGLAFINSTTIDTAVTPAQAEDGIFGVVVACHFFEAHNQAEQQAPTGTALTTIISPWIVTLDALEPLRQSAPDHLTLPLPYLSSGSHHYFNINLEAHLETRNDFKQKLLQVNLSYLYWNLGEQLAEAVGISTAGFKNLHFLTPIRGLEGEQTGNYADILQLVPGLKGEPGTVVLNGYGEHAGLRIGFG